MMEYKNAKRIADEAVIKLQPYCQPDRIHIAGSIRRKAPLVKDIEIVCLPMTKEIKDLFGSVSAVVRETGFITTAGALGQILKGRTSGKYVKIELPEKIMLDLFIPNDYDYFRQLAIRTGSADFSAKILARAWRKMGWCGSDMGLRKVSDCTQIQTPGGKYIWKCKNPSGPKPPVWKSEEEFFQWLWVPYVEPSKRYV